MMRFRPLSVVVWWAGAYAATECIVVVLASLVFATTWPWVALCACVEGALLGLAQGWLLRGIRRRLAFDWTLATVAGLLLGRFIEYTADLSPVAGALLRSPFIVQISAGAALGAIVGAASGSFQALLLRGVIRHPYRWIAVCGAAWALTLPALLVVGFAGEQLSGIPVWRAAVALLVLFAGIGAGTGAIEGLGLTWLLQAPERQCRPVLRLDREPVEHAV